VNQYGEAAVQAVKLYTAGRTRTPRDAWDEAAARVFGPGTSAQKGCPRNAFLGLCEEGLVRGVPQGSYCSSLKNKAYAVAAVALLRREPRLAQDPARLWNLVMKGEQKRHNSQMDVVAALWRAGLVG